MRAHVLVLVLVTSSLLAACGGREPPPAAAEEMPTGTELRDAIQAPQNKARAVEGQLQGAAQRKREDIDEASGD